MAVYKSKDISGCLVILKDGPDLLEDAIDCLVSVDVPDLLILLELANDLQRLLSVSFEPLLDDLRSVIAAPLLRPDFQSPHHLLLATHQMQHKRTASEVPGERPPGVEVLQVSREAVDHEELAWRGLHLLLEELDGDGTGDDFALGDELADGAAELRGRPFLLLPQQLSCREVPEAEVPFDEGGLRAFARPGTTQHEHHLESPHASIIFMMQCSDGEGASHSVLGHAQLLPVAQLVARPLLVLRRVVLLQLGVLPPQVLVQFAFLQVLPVQDFVALLQPADALQQPHHFLALVPAWGQAVQTIVDAGVLFDGQSKRLQFFLGDVLMLETVENALELLVVFSKHLLNVRQLSSLFLESLEVPALFYHQFLATLRLKLLDSHVGRTLTAWLQQRLVEGFLVRDESSLVVDLLLVLDQSLPAYLRLLLLDLLGDEELETQAGALLEELLDSGELCLALRQRPLQQPRISKRLQLHGQR